MKFKTWLEVPFFIFYLCVFIDFTLIDTKYIEITIQINNKKKNDTTNKQNK